MEGESGRTGGGWEKGRGERDMVVWRLCCWPRRSGESCCIRCRRLPTPATSSRLFFAPSSWSGGKEGEGLRFILRLEFRAVVGPVSGSDSLKAACARAEESEENGWEEKEGRMLECYQ